MMKIGIYLALLFSTSENTEKVISGLIQNKVLLESIFSTASCFWIDTYLSFIGVRHLLQE